MTTDIESRELKRITNMEQGLPPEHPRAATTDDVECFFSILRDSVGKYFTVKQLQYTKRKLGIEFIKEWALNCHFIILRLHTTASTRDLYQALTSQGLGRNDLITLDTRESLIEISLEAW